MRAYKLEIADFKLNNGNLLKSSFEIGTNYKKGQNAPQIEFSIKAFDSSSASVPSIIKIYNMPKDAYKKLRELTKKNSQITLSVGWDTNYSLHSKLNSYKTIGMRPILVGRVQNVLGNFSTLDNYIIISTAMVNDNQLILNDIQKLNNKQNNTSFNLQLNNNDLIYTIIEKAFKNVLFKDWQVKFSIYLKSLKYQNKNSMLGTYCDLASLINLISNNLNIEGDGISVKVDTSKNTILVYKSGDYKDLLTINNSLSVINLSYADLLSQPEYLGYGNNLSVVIGLNPLLHLGSIVKIGNIQSTLGSALQGWTPSSGGIKDFNIIQNGLYIVNQMLHNGNFYGRSADSWATQLNLIPLGS